MFSSLRDLLLAFQLKFSYIAQSNNYWLFQVLIFRIPNMPAYLASSRTSVIGIEVLLLFHRDVLR